MTELWTPSDDALASDPIALQHVNLPFDPPDLEGQGVQLPDLGSDDDEAIELAAAIALAELEDDDVAGDEPGASDDDDEIDDTTDEPVAADV